MFKKKQIIKRYSLMTFYLLLLALMFNLVILPHKIDSGSILGLALVVAETFTFDYAIVLAFIMISISLLSLITLDFNRVLKSIYSVVALPFLIKLTANVSLLSDFGSGDEMILALFAGVVIGLVQGMAERLNVGVAGADLLSRMLSKVFKLSSKTVEMIMSLSIIILIALNFGTVNMLYSVIILYISRETRERIVLGISSNKHVVIVTTEHQKIVNYLSKEANYGATIFDAKGGYENKAKKAIMTVIPTRDYFKFKEKLEQLDTNAFFVVTDSYQLQAKN